MHNQKDPVSLDPGIREQIRLANEAEANWLADHEQPATAPSPQQVDEAAMQEIAQAKEQPKMTRKQAKRLARRLNYLPGNNKKDSSGRKVRKTEILADVVVPEEPTLMDVVTFVVGKGGKRKRVVRKQLVSRTAIESGELNIPGFWKLVTDDEGKECEEMRIVQLHNSRRLRRKKF